MTYFHGSVMAAILSLAGLKMAPFNERRPTPLYGSKEYENADTRAGADSVQPQPNRPASLFFCAALAQRRRVGWVVRVRGWGQSWLDQSILGF